MFITIALLALVITIIVTLTMTVLLLREARKPESERKSEIFQPEHIENPKTEADWEEWDKDEWADLWKDDEE
jgi:hypothetical protein